MASYCYPLGLCGGFQRRGIELLALSVPHDYGLSPEYQTGPETRRLKRSYDGHVLTQNQGVRPDPASFLLAA